MTSPLGHYGFQAKDRMVLKYPSTFANNDLTPSVQAGNFFKCATGHSAARNITMLDDGYDGQYVIIKGANPTYKTTIVDGTYMNLNGNWIEAANNMLVLIFLVDTWYELCRSANA